METLKNYFGYAEDFISSELPVPLPTLTPEQQADVALVAGTTDNVARYVNYSLVQSQSRGFPYFTASNIDGHLFKRVARKDNWRKDERINHALQWGQELYSAPQSNFDRGHLVKREDVQWGTTVLEAQNAADSTFFFTNAVPQHAQLNQAIWADLENYILHTESVQNNLRIMVFTGPVLNEADPVFVTEVNGAKVKLPVLFWKVVVFTKGDNQLYRVGFLMGQTKLLEKGGIIKPQKVKLPALVAELFTHFEDAETYQVNIATLETLTQLKMPPATDVYQDDRPIKLILEEVDINANIRAMEAFVKELGFRIPNLVL